MFHQTQPGSGRNNSWERDDATGPLISATPVWFVCGKGGRHSGVSGGFLVCYFCPRQTHAEGPFCRPWGCSRLFCWAWPPSSPAPSLLLSSPGKEIRDAIGRNPCRCKNSMQHDRGGISNQVRKRVLCSLNDSGITGYSSEK